MELTSRFEERIPARKTGGWKPHRVYSRETETDDLADHGKGATEVTLKEISRV
jgi:hypothetical protein